MFFSVAFSVGALCYLYLFLSLSLCFFVLDVVGSGPPLFNSFLASSFTPYLRPTLSVSRVWLAEWARLSRSSTFSDTPMFQLVDIFCVLEILVGAAKFLQVRRR